MRNTFMNPLPGVPDVESPFLDAIFAGKDVDDETSRIARSLHEHGFAVFDFPDPDFDGIVEAIKANLDDRFAWQDWREQGWQAGQGLRIQDAWTLDANVRRIATNKAVIDLLTLLYGRPAWPFQTLSFPVGTQQPYHADAVHFHTVPERYMCGVWVAFEDIDEDCGPLVYYPGSHRWPIFGNEHIGFCAATWRGTPTQERYEQLWRSLVDLYGAKPEIFVARKGQALIWCANLLHGGIRHNNKEKTRWSQVTHYFFKGCAYYTPLYSDPVFGNIAFRNMMDIRDETFVPNMYNGERISDEFIATTNRRGDLPADSYEAAEPVQSPQITASADEEPPQGFERTEAKSSRSLELLRRLRRSTTPR